MRRSPHNPVVPSCYHHLASRPISHPKFSKALIYQGFFRLRRSIGSRQRFPSDQSSTIQEKSPWCFLSARLLALQFKPTFPSLYGVLNKYDLDTPYCDWWKNARIRSIRIGRVAFRLNAWTLLSPTVQALHLISDGDRDFH